MIDPTKQASVRAPLLRALRWTGSLGVLVASALVMIFAATTPGYRWVGCIALLPLFNAIRVQSPVRAAFDGAIWGLCLFAFATILGVTRIPFDLFSGALLPAVLGLYAFLGARITRQVGFSPYLLALCWIGVELALKPLGLRYGLLGGTQSGGFSIELIGGFAGYGLVAFLVAYVNAALLTVLSEVRVSTCASRVVSSAAQPRLSVFPIEIPSYLSYLILPSQPRAPPV